MKSRISEKSVDEFLFKTFGVISWANFKASFSLDKSNMGIECSIDRTYFANKIPALECNFPFLGNRISEIIPRILFLYLLKYLSAFS